MAEVINQSPLFLLLERVRYRENASRDVWDIQPYRIEAYYERHHHTNPTVIWYTLLPDSPAPSWTEAKCFVRPDQLQRWHDQDQAREQGHG